MKTSHAVAELLGALAVTMLVKPLMLICGINWLLEVATLNQVPYSLASWFGALLVIMAFNVTINTKTK